MTLTIEHVPIDSIQRLPGNPRIGDIDRIATSLQQFGQMKPLVVQESTGFIVAGNHTYAAAQQIGMDTIAIVRVPLSDEQVRAYAIADNRMSDLSTWDDTALSTMLSELMESGALDGTGYTADEVDDLLALLGRLEETQPGEFTGGHAPVWADPAQTRDGELGRDGPPLRQIMLLYDPDEAERAGEAVKRLQAAWDISTVAGVVLKALERAAASCA